MWDLKTKIWGTRVVTADEHINDGFSRETDECSPERAPVNVEEMLATSCHSADVAL